MKKFSKILILWSWALKIGEAWEFDYSGSQAIKAVKEEGIKTILINPNIATVQTDEWFADEIYFLPVTAFFVEKVIEKEKPDALMLSFWGQTALNCWLELENSWVLEKYGVSVLGTPVETIEITEDRKKFNQALDAISVKYAKSKTAKTEKEAMKIASDIGYPVLVRSAFALGGLGSWFASDEKELKTILKKAFSFSHQVIIDESLKGWKEIEYEVVRDANDNCITVCNMENFDPMGIHTGESIVVAPSQTLSQRDYHLLRDVALKTIRHLGIIGECNIQYAYNPNSMEYRVIEVNARLSRSSALASKATGYPLAYVAAKIGLGYTLDTIKNSITQVTSAFFEPSLDYIVVKFPRWDLQKFEKVKKEIGSEMKSVGEVMSIGRSFEEAIQKAVRSLDQGYLGLVGNEKDFHYDKKSLSSPTPERIFIIVEAIKKSLSLEEIHVLTGIDMFFLKKIENIIKTDTELLSLQRLTTKDTKLIRKAKKQGFSDKQIAIITHKRENDIREFRYKENIFPYVKQIDTLAWEFKAHTNYLYTTYHGSEDDIDFTKKSKKKKVLVIGSWAYRIGSSVEFDWCGVNTLKTLKTLGYETLVLNFNPETVSTDYTSSDSLYFDEINLEKVLDICEKEKVYGVVVSVWWQIANNLALPLKKAGIHILGTDPSDIDKAEDRNKFSALLDKIGVDQPVWAELGSIKAAKDFSKKVGYPVLIRPSYVLSWANMKVCMDEEQLVNFLKKVGNISKEHPAVISKFEQGAKEIEIDGVAKNGELVIYALGEHIENAWVHSGDATIVLPAQRLYIETVRRIKIITKKIVKELKITGPFNIQFLALANDIKVIECNLRASRSFPFVSKVLKYNFIDIATKAILGEDVVWEYNTLDLDYVGLKAAQFSFHRLAWADPRLGVEMASTWEVACLGKNIYEAFLKALIAVGITPPKKWVLISIGGMKNKLEFMDAVLRLQKMGYNLYATPWTQKFFKKKWIKMQRVDKVWEKHDVIEFMQKKKVDFVINTPSSEDIRSEETTGYALRRKAIDMKIPILTDRKLASLYIKSLFILWWESWLSIDSYKEF